MRAPDIAVRASFRYLVGRGHHLLRFRPRVWWQASPGDMVGDVFQAILWMKDHAESMGVDPQKIVLIGESAGAHLSLMAAYTAHQDIFCPEPFANQDRSVAGVGCFLSSGRHPSYIRTLGQLEPGRIDFRPVR